jgi:hypothetical protein
MKKLISLLNVAIITVTLSGCMQMRIVAFSDSNNPVPEKVTRTTYFWGLKQREGIKTPEGCSSICSVMTKTNMGQILLSTITLGIVVPQTLEYSCCPFEPPPAEN